MGPGRGAPEHSSPSPTNHESFTFGSLVAGGTLECKLDAGAFKVCTSPQEAASYKWTVEATPPAKLTITPEGKSPSPNNHEKLTFGGVVAGDTLECRLDSGEWKACRSPQEFTELSNGEHAVEVRQKNKAGVNSEAASYKWTVAATVPTRSPHGGNELGMPPVASEGGAGPQNEFVPGSFAGRQAAAALALQCTSSGLTLIDVLIRHNRVVLFGAADKSLIGRTVAINLVSAHKPVATAVVWPDGLFGTTAPLPPLSIRNTNEALYQATAAGRRSAALKLMRRLHVSSIASVNGRVVMRGRVSLPLAVPIATIVFERRTSCHSTVVVAKVKPRANGTFQVSLPAPLHSQSTVYQARTMVRGIATSRATFPTFTLPRVVVVE